MLGRAGLTRLPRRTQIVQAPSALLLIAAVLLAALALFAPGHALAQQFPKLTGRVVDAANVIPPDEEARLTLAFGPEFDLWAARTRRWFGRK